MKIHGPETLDHHLTCKDVLIKRYADRINDLEKHLAISMQLADSYGRKCRLLQTENAHLDRKLVYLKSNILDLFLKEDDSDLDSI